MFILEFPQIMAYHFLSHFKSSLPLFVQCSFVLARVKLLSPLIRILSFHFPFFYSDFSSANLAVAIIISNFQSKYNNISDLCVCANDANNRRASMRQIFAQPLRQKRLRIFSRENATNILAHTHSRTRAAQTTSASQSIEDKLSSISILSNPLILFVFIFCFRYRFLGFRCARIMLISSEDSLNLFSRETFLCDHHIPILRPEMFFI